VVDELPDLPHLPELPERGPGADMVGRTAAMLPDLAIDRQPSGWRLTARPGREARRAASYLSADLDAFQEALEGRDGPVKVALVGPWTLAAALQLPRGEPVLSDPGAVRDLRQALAEAAGVHLRDMQRRLPGSELILQLDEPGLPSVLDGRVPSFSGVRSVRAASRQDAQSGLAEVVDAAAALGVPVIAHCCADVAPVSLFREAGVAGISVDLTLLGSKAYDDLGEAVEAGVALVAGVVPATDTATATVSDPAATVEPVRRLWSRLGLSPETLSTGVVVTPTCGLAGASPAHALRAMRLAVEAARILADG
jgi:methionine synthase II (cobalamin-independent)